MVILFVHHGFIWRRIEVVITGRTRNAFALWGTRVRIPPSPSYQGTNFDRKTAFHFGGLFFYLWPEMLEISAFSGGFLFLRLIAQPFVIALSVKFWILYNGQSVLNTDGVT